MKKQPVQLELFRQKLKLKSLQSQKSFKDNFPEAQKFLDSSGVSLNRIREHSAKLISAGAITGTLLLTPPVGLDLTPDTNSSNIAIHKDVNDNQDLPQKSLIDSLKNMLPSVVRPLYRDEEKRLEQVVSDTVGVKVKATLEGEHLNTIYGFIGAEQHLKRYPGDILENHGPYYKEGIAPGLGAWGYFSKSKQQLTEDLLETEKWYSVVQTLYLPDWNSRQPYLRDWYKYRKLLIVNTQNGNAVVTALADSGPAAWTGKQFGGSPEVMEYLGGSKYKKGAVLVFFVDDPENKVKLGPVEYNKVNVVDNLVIEI